MPLTNVGTTLLTSLLAGNGGTPFNGANSYVGVGDSTATFVASQTDLQASSNKYRQAVDGGFPNVSGNTLVFQVTVSTANANFDWNEWGIFNAISSGTMLNRKVFALGTKVNTQSWQFTVTLTIVNS